MMEAERTSETSLDNYFTRQYIPEGNSERTTIVGQVEYETSVTVLYILLTTTIFS
jgi:hypothetical protein